ncbi:hypothetical protein [Streptomyces sp. HYC2]|uniref:hypothetical protein n=1 Tax=Streptomyces sp. HYC2 TaxID=2955207 RepID=UPI0024801D0D|nr:hypothetical protein [Streptomyces sp. HYC2]
MPNLLSATQPSCNDHLMDEGIAAVVSAGIGIAGTFAAGLAGVVATARANRRSSLQERRQQAYAELVAARQGAYFALEGFLLIGNNNETAMQEQIRIYRNAEQKLAETEAKIRVIGPPRIVEIAKDITKHMRLTTHKLSDPPGPERESFLREGDRLLALFEKVAQEIVAK